MENIIEQTTTQEYNEIKSEIKKRYSFASVSRNNQNYAYGGFNIRPRDYHNGFTNEQIDKLCIFLKSSGYDTEEFSIEQSECVYGEDQGEFAGTKMKYLMFHDGFSFLIKISKTNAKVLVGATPTGETTVERLLRNPKVLNNPSPSNSYDSQQTYHY